MVDTKQDAALARMLANDVARAARKTAKAREELDQAIRIARKAGLPLRTIAKAAGLSPEWVRRIASG